MDQLDKVSLSGDESHPQNLMQEKPTTPHMFPNKPLDQDNPNLKLTAEHQSAKVSSNNLKTQSCSPSARRPAPRKNVFGRFVATVKVATVIAAAAMRTVCPKMLAARTV